MLNLSLLGLGGLILSLFIDLFFLVQAIISFFMESLLMLTSRSIYRCFPAYNFAKTLSFNFLTICVCFSLISFEYAVLSLF